MNLNLTREELQHDLKTIVVSAITEAKRDIIKMVNEDLIATNRRIDNLSHRMDKRFKQVDEKIDETNAKIDLTHQLLHVHIANPSAHSRTSQR